MRRQCASVALAVLVTVAAGARAESRVAEPADLMPRVEDYTSMWWVDGFPPAGPGAAWLRCIRTGCYALVLNTETLEIPHFGPVPPGTAYTQYGAGDVPAWSGLQPAKLELTIAANGKTWRCTAGGKWSRFGGPRLIESGRFFQRADVTDLVFTADDGQRLEVEARLEAAAWPDRLALLLAARPQGDAVWRDTALELRFTSGTNTLHRRRASSAGEPWEPGEWRQVALALDPITLVEAESNSPLTVEAEEIPGGAHRPVSFDPTLGWHRVNLDGIEPIVPPDGATSSNDAIERVRLELSNPAGHEQIARLMFEKTARGIRQRIGAPITGISAMLRDANGNPTGIPVQLSKNWHTRPEGGVYVGQWFHGISQVRLPAGASVELELTICYGHWGCVPAASHAQLSLIGWGSNQHWSQAALGAWGESICFEPDQVQADCTITDVRPAMVAGTAGGKKWAWTSNVGGGDFFRFFAPSGDRVPLSAMRTIYHRQGPCLTEVTFAGRIGNGIAQSVTVSLGRTDDLVRGVYRLRMDVTQPMEFSRFVLFQIGADTYSYTGERKMALGNADGLVKEWETHWGGNSYRTERLECTGRVPWVSLHEAVPRENLMNGAWANRGIVIRSWKARLGGKDASPWIAERGLTLHKKDTSTLDILPPPGVSRLEPGDFVEATVEHIVMPQYARDYYGPNEALRAALAKDESTWRLILREACGNDRQVRTTRGTLERRCPDVRVRVTDGQAAFTLTGGLGYVPITFTGLTSPADHTLLLDGEPLDQSVHGNDFWQTDYDPAIRRWSRTYNVPVHDDQPHSIQLSAAQ